MIPQNKGIELFGESWYKILKDEINKEYFTDIGKTLKEEREKRVKIYPDKEDYFKAFKLTPFGQVRVIIIGQDPYHTKGVADGLAFSCKKEFHTPPSLQIIFNEIENDIYDGLKLEQDTNLDRWAIQGVLLLNKYLSVEEGKSLSHNYIGWDQFTNFVISKLSELRNDLVFILWGKEAQKVEKLINTDKHLIIKGVHPASVFYNEDKFSGGKYFSRANEYLKRFHKTEIIW